MFDTERGLILSTNVKQYFSDLLPFCINKRGNIVFDTEIQ
jgi:hypothetical protein